MRACPTREGKGACACSTDQVSNTRLAGPPRFTWEDRMLFHFTGTVRPSDLEKILGPLGDMLAEAGVETITSMDLNFIVWGAVERKQIVDEDGFVTSLRIDAEKIAELPSRSVYSMPEGISFRDRPADMEFSLLNIAFGRDD